MPIHGLNGTSRLVAGDDLGATVTHDISTLETISAPAGDKILICEAATGNIRTTSSFPSGTTAPAGGSGAFARDAPNALIEKTVPNTDSVIFTDVNVASLDWVGPGLETKFVFNHPLAATRLGRAGTGRWNVSNTGLLSFASGLQPEATGNYSVAFGFADNASTGTRATSSASFVIGLALTGGLVESTGQASLCFGAGNTVSGGGNPATVRASGNGSLGNGTAFQGGVVEATGEGSHSHGSVSGPQSGITRLRATNIGSSASGYVIANGVGTGGGQEITSSGIGSNAFGQSSTDATAPTTTIIASNIASQAGGFSEQGGQILSSGIASVAMGYAFGVVSIPSRVEATANCAWTIGQAFNNARILNSGASSLLISNNSATSDVSTNSGLSSIVVGQDVQNTNSRSIILGQYGNARTTGTGSITTTTSSLQILGGASNSTRDTMGCAVILGIAATGAGATGGGEADFFNTAGAEYAEFCEKSVNDNSFRNADNTIDIGYAVTVGTDGLIKKAGALDTVIGITVAKIHGRAGITGNKAPKHWHGMLKRDDFGVLDLVYCYQDCITELIKKHKVKITAEIKTIIETESDTMKTDLLAIESFTSNDKDFDETVFRQAITDIESIPRVQVSDAYDPKRKYNSRQKRNEYTSVGMLGQIRVRDDGSCLPGVKCSVSALQKGVMTLGNKWFVKKRISANVIEIYYS